MGDVIYGQSLWQKITFSGCFSKFHHLLSPDAGTEDNGISTEPISLLLFPGLLPLTVSMMNWRNPSSTEKKKLITFALNNNVEYESYPNPISHSKCGTMHSWFKGHLES